MRKNILVIAVVSGFLPKFEMENVRILRQMGYEVHYAANFENPIYECDPADLEKKGVRCHSIPIQKSPLALRQNAKALKQVKHLIEEFDIQAIHCHNPVGGLIGRIAGMENSKRKDGRKGNKGGAYCIYTAHGFHFFKGAPIHSWLCFYPAEWLLARLTDQLICVNREDKRRAERFSLRPGGAVCRIPGTGVDRKRFFRPLPEERNQARESLALKEEDLVFLSVGELNENKNHQTVIQALRELNQPCAKYLICGEGPLRGKLEARIKELGLEKQVFLQGYQREIEKYYWCADCFVFPSIREGLGMAAIEAMACGLPVICSRNRGSREYEGDGTLTYGTGNRKLLSQHMKRIAEDRALREKMGRAAEETAKGFSVEKTRPIMNAVYQRMNAAIQGSGSLEIR